MQNMLMLVMNFTTGKQSIAERQRVQRINGIRDKRDKRDKGIKKDNGIRG